MDSSLKRNVLITIFLSLGLVYIIRLAVLQLFDDSYLRSAQQNVLQEQTIYPARGLIYDRHGDLLVYNDAIYDLMVTPDQVKNLDTVDFCKVLGITYEGFIQRFEKMKRSKGYAPYREQVFEKQLSIQTYAAFQEKMFDFLGFTTIVRTDRRYKYSDAAHVMGYIGEVTDKDIEKSADYYRLGDFIGISGVERTYEEVLRGKKGVSYVLVDSKNRTQGRYKDGLFDTAAVAGQNIELSIDHALQQLGEQLLNNKIGSIVAIEPTTGEIFKTII
jgi:penicillin-binding protein 2